MIKLTYIQSKYCDQGKIEPGKGYLTSDLMLEETELMRITVKKANNKLFFILKFMPYRFECTPVTVLY